LESAPTTPQRLETLTIRNSLAESLSELDEYCEHKVDLGNVFDGISESIYSDQGHMGRNIGHEMLAHRLFEVTLPIVQSSYHN